MDVAINKNTVGCFMEINSKKKKKNHMNCVFEFNLIFSSKSKSMILHSKLKQKHVDT